MMTMMNDKDFTVGNATVRAAAAWLGVLHAACLEGANRARGSAGKNLRNMPGQSRDDPVKKWFVRLHCLLFFHGPKIILGYEVSCEKCSEIFPEYFELLFGFQSRNRTIPAKFPAKIPCAKSTKFTGELRKRKYHRDVEG